MNQPWVYMCSPFWTTFPPSSPSRPSGSSQCTGPERSASCIKPGLAICFAYGNIHVSMLFSQIIPPSPLLTEHNSLFLGEGGGKGLLDEEHMYTPDWFRSMYGKNHHEMPGASTGDPTHDKVMWRGLMGKENQVSRGPLSEHLPQNQNLSVYCLLYYTLLT